MTPDTRPEATGLREAVDALTEAEQKILGIRDGDCGCCFIVDSTGFRQLLAARDAATADRARREGAVEGEAEVYVAWAVRWPDGQMTNAMYSPDGDDYAEQVIRRTAEGVGGEAVHQTVTTHRTPWTVAGPFVARADRLDRGATR